MNKKLIFFFIFIFIILKKIFFNEHFLFGRKHVIADFKVNNINVDKTNQVLTLCKNENCINKTFKFQMTDPNLTHLADDKVSSKLVMISNGIPVSKFTVLRLKYSIKDINFLLNRHDVKFPVVYKPIKGTWGNSIKTNIFSVEDLYDYIQSNSNITDFYIEQQYFGENYRIFCIDDDVIDIIHRKKPQVIGNGNDPLKILIENSNNNRKENGHPDLKPDLDFILKTYNYNLESIAKENEVIIITDVVNYHRGSVACRVDLNSVHPDNIEMFKRINNIFGIKISGIDYITSDISKSYKEEGVIIEINTGPDDAIHYKTECGGDNKEFRRKYIKKFFPELEYVNLAE